MSGRQLRGAAWIAERAPGMQLSYLKELSQMDNKRGWIIAGALDKLGECVFG